VGSCEARNWETEGFGGSDEVPGRVVAVASGATG
jgi:hypothetical protein